jgi:hypothetical protein
MLIAEELGCDWSKHDVGLDPRALDRVRSLRRETLDRRDGAAADRTDRQDARPHCPLRDGPGPGFACSTCHATANPPASYGVHMPPGAPTWQLPPPETRMVFIGLSSGDLCRTVKDEDKNGGKDLEALLEHVSHDKLVLWGWSPGVGRAPVSTPHAEFVAKFREWVEAGAPCAR